ncbi:hypothetical protein GCM10008171_11620 [Methylopila jiangsuensis]|uniref:Uncharacterized protein n=1 Tax=Methylopila jiangsuensis TaxID=586230 RepID=A0A9W6JI19_9HYPH|nr:hypothetical protein GCM10008171_11620 [Methylopila jiangsuensis]
MRRPPAEALERPHKGREEAAEGVDLGATLGAAELRHLAPPRDVLLWPSSRSIRNVIA